MKAVCTLCAPRLQAWESRPVVEGYEPPMPSPAALRPPLDESNVGIQVS
jgi:hypothetical protein